MKGEEQREAEEADEVEATVAREVTIRNLGRFKTALREKYERI